MWKVIFNKNKKWRNSEDSLYTYSDFIFTDLKELCIKDIIIFYFFIKLFYFVFKIYVLIILFFFINIKVLKIEIKIVRGGLIGKILEKAFVNSKIMAEIKIKDLNNIKVFKKILIQVSFLVIWGYPKICISWGIYIFNFIRNWFKYSRRELIDLENKMIKLLENSISEDYRNLDKM